MKIRIDIQSEETVGTYMGAPRVPDLYVETPYRKAFVEDLKRDMQGTARWDPAKKRWKVPAIFNAELFRLLRAHFPGKRAWSYRSGHFTIPALPLKEWVKAVHGYDADENRIEF